ncbi:MAG: hypothetical protein WD960_09545 [Gemmatimonadota bacterium]
MYGVRNVRVNLVPPARAILSVLLVLVAPCHGEAQEWLEATDPSIGIALGTSGFGVEAGSGRGSEWAHDSPSDEFPSSRTSTRTTSQDRSPSPPDHPAHAGLVSTIRRLPPECRPPSIFGGISAWAVARDTVEFNDRDYGPEELGEVTGRVWGRENAPYLGLGWQRRTARIQPTLDLGVAFTGTPRITVTVSGPAGNDPTFRADLDSEVREAEEEIFSYLFSPHLALGLRIRLGG